MYETRRVKVNYVKMIRDLIIKHNFTNFFTNKAYLCQGYDTTIVLGIVHCVKSDQIWSFFWSVFSCIRTRYGDLLGKSPYSVRVQESTDQKKLRIWTLFTQWSSMQYRNQDLVIQKIPNLDRIIA